ncbi:hypothetical protein HGP16_17695 [Rhizobium sp. P40RR-XXII]|nr:MULTISPECIES: hypothetical protein [unclassified Rhizobium]NLR87735.1 hypothetical protein [Rhizobium sp. P28RR-XV]NLS18395.1 hypothetical protein [Rhizobium sp. P40RR-XXII]
MFTRSVFSAIFLALIGLGIPSCSTTGNSGSGSGMTQNSAPTGGGY